MKCENVISTGFRPLDKILNGGFRGGSLNVIAARPGMGKTTFAMQCACAMAKNTDKKIYIFSLESPSNHIKKKFAGSCNQDKIIIDDSAPIKPSQIRTKLSKISALGAVMIDYFQLLRLEDGDCEQNATIRANTLSGELKRIAREFDVPVICTAQLSRSVEERQNQRPILSDLDKNNGSLVQDADVILFLYRDYYSTKEDRSVTELIVAKNRYGSCGNLSLCWDFEKMYIYDQDLLLYAAGFTDVRDPKRIDAFCDRLKEVWKKVPDWRFGQLVVNVLNSMMSSGRDPFFPEDEEMIAYFEKYFHDR